MRGRMAMLGLYIKQGAPWFADLQAELLSFPAGKHDDQVDALGLVGQLLDIMRAGKAPARVAPVRGIDAITIDEAWRLCRPRFSGLDERI